MKPFMFVLLPALGLSLTGCDDSTTPLSDPATAKADLGLLGVWRQRGDDGQVTYYHVGRADNEKLPQGVLRVVGVEHKQGKVDPPAEYLVFSTTLGDKTYLNVIFTNEQTTNTLEEKGWKAETVDSYTILRYKVDGNKASVWVMDSDAMKRAIEGGKIKGIIERDGAEKIKCTDTTENFARFVAQAGDSLFAKEPVAFERIDGGK